MSPLSLLVRLFVVLAVVCLVSGQGDMNSSSSSTGASFSSSSIAASSSSSSSSSTGTVPVDSSSGMNNGSMSSSTGGVMATSSSVPSGPVPQIWYMVGCNGTFINNQSIAGLTGCDGASGNSAITIVGFNFTSSVTVQVVCPSNSYSAQVTNVVNSGSPNMVYCLTPPIDKVDNDKDCQLYVTNSDNQKSASKTIHFTSWSTDIEEAFRILGLSFMSFIIAVVVIGIVILVATILCTLACCCGVSLAFLNCCCPSRSGTTVVLSPQGSGYASME